MADVRLTDLEIIQRYSIAVRGETADRAELVAALRSDLTWLEGGARTRRPAAASTSGVAVDADFDDDDLDDVDLDDVLDRGRGASAPATARTPKSPARRPVAGKSAARKTATPKPAARRAATPKPAARRAATPKPAARRAATPKPAARRAATPKPAARKTGRAAAPAQRTAKKTSKPAARRGR